MLNLSLNELELKAKNRGTESNKSMSIDKLSNMLYKSEQLRKLKEKMHY